jgi:hypothetical protein
VETILRKLGIGEIPLAEALRKFDETPDNHKITLAPGLEVVKWSVEKIDLDLSNSRLMSPLVPLKIGFEFLACHLGTAIYDKAQQLQELRTVLREIVEDDPCLEVERLNASEYKPFHASVLRTMIHMRAYSYDFLGGSPSVFISGGCQSVGQGSFTRNLWQREARTFGS